MQIEIIIPVNESTLADGRELNHEYVKEIGNQPLLQPYFKAQSFDADIEKMPQGYEAPDGVFLVAYVDGVAAGVVAVRQLDDTTCEMKRLYVRAKYRGMGLGKLLAERAIVEAKNLGYAKMRLDNSRSVMAKANSVYKSLGFYEIEPYNENSVADAYFMEKILS
jgi:ribosomal protein S18 acetylase RimI-like enzyme